MGFPAGASGKEPAWQRRRCRRQGFDSIPGSGRFPWRRKWQSAPVFLAWKIPWTEEPGGLQSLGSQSDMTHAHTHTHKFHINYNSVSWLLKKKFTKEMCHITSILLNKRYNLHCKVLGTFHQDKVTLLCLIHRSMSR